MTSDVQVTLREIASTAESQADTPGDSQPSTDTTSPPSHARTSTPIQLKDSVKAQFLLSSADFDRLGIDLDDADTIDYWTTDGHLVLDPST